MMGNAKVMPLVVTRKGNQEAKYLKKQGPCRTMMMDTTQIGFLCLMSLVFSHKVQIVHIPCLPSRAAMKVLVPVALTIPTILPDQPAVLWFELCPAVCTLHLDL